MRSLKWRFLSRRCSSHPSSLNSRTARRTQNRWQVTQIARADIPLVGEEHGRPWAPGFGRIVETEATLEAGVRVVFARQLLPQQIATWESICCSLTPLSLLLLEAIGRLGATRIR